MEVLHLSLATLNMHLHTHWRPVWGGLTRAGCAYPHLPVACENPQSYACGVCRLQVEFGVGRCGRRIKLYLCGLLNVDSMDMKLT